MGTACACKPIQGKVQDTYNYDPTFASALLTIPNVELAIKQLAVFFETERIHIPEKLVPHYEKVLNGDYQTDSALVIRLGKLGEKGVDYLCKLIPFYVRITELRLWKSGISRNSLNRLFPTLTLLSSLKVLSLEDNGLKDDSVLALVRGFNHMQDLEELWLGCNDISSSGAKVLANSFDTVPLLHTLDLSYNYIENEGCIYLCWRLEASRRLKVLILQANLLNSEAVKALCSLASTNPPSDVADVSRNRFTDSECQSLIAAFGSEIINATNQKEEKAIHT